MKVVIDRFEGDFAVIELPGGEMKNIEKSKIPPNAKEGDILVIEDDKIWVDEDETKERKAQIEEMMEDMWK